MAQAGNGLRWLSCQSRYAPSFLKQIVFVLEAEPKPARFFYRAYRAGFKCGAAVVQRFSQLASRKTLTSQLFRFSFSSKAGLYVPALRESVAWSGRCGLQHK
jgi:hypothetical protein